MERRQGDRTQRPDNLALAFLSANSRKLGGWRYLPGTTPDDYCKLRLKNPQGQHLEARKSRISRHILAYAPTPRQKFLWPIFCATRCGASGLGRSELFGTTVGGFWALPLVCSGHCGYLAR